MPGWSYIAKRVGFALGTLFVVITFNFVLFRALPGNAVTDISRVPGATPAVQHALAHDFGLDKSLPEQYVLYLGQLAHGNLGVSFETRDPVASDLGQALLNTIPMVALGTLLAIGLGIVFGAVAAWRRGTASDWGPTNLALAFYALPVQWVGMMLLLVFAGTLPSGGMSDPFLTNATVWQTLGDRLQHIALPALTFALTLFGQYALIMRSSMLETLGEDYILAARARGFGAGTVVRKEALRNALLPTVSLIGLSVGFIVGGSILIETVFSWPGIGRAVFDAVRARDYPMLQGAFLVLTASVIVCNLIADLVQFRLDPRLRV